MINLIIKGVLLAFCFFVLLMSLNGLVEISLLRSLFDFLYANFWMVLSKLINMALMLCALVLAYCVVKADMSGKKEINKK